MIGPAPHLLTNEGPMIARVHSWWHILRAPHNRWLWYAMAVAIYLTALMLPLPDFSTEAKQALGVACVAALALAGTYNYLVTEYLSEMAGG